MSQAVQGAGRQAAMKPKARQIHKMQGQGLLLDGPKGAGQKAGQRAVAADVVGAGQLRPI